MWKARTLALDMVLYKDKGKKSRELSAVKEEEYFMLLKDSNKTGKVSTVEEEEYFRSAEVAWLSPGGGLVFLKLESYPTAEVAGDYFQSY